MAQRDGTRPGTTGARPVAAPKVADGAFPALELTVDEVLRLDAPRIDLRSPSEFAQDHLPGARNVPLFDDAERSLVGTLYKQSGRDAAHSEALSITRAKVQGLVDRLAGGLGLGVDADDLTQRVEAISTGGVAAMERRLAGRPADAAAFARRPAPLVLCCWRGGLRSRSVAALLTGLGGDAAIVAGGYKAYRAWVLERLAVWRAPRAIVLRGLTGVGKTLVLRELERLLPGATIDLERHAGHRSSILGAVGLEPTTQKAFEGGLAARLEQGFPHGVVVFEGESRKVGDVIVPERLWRALETGASVELVAPLARRVEVLLSDYLATADAREALRPGLAFIERRLGAKHAGALLALLDAGRDAELCEVLLERYYDPLYRHSERGRRTALELDASDPAAAAAVIAGRMIHGEPRR